MGGRSEIGHALPRHLTAKRLGRSQRHMMAPESGLTAQAVVVGAGPAGGRAAPAPPGGRVGAGPGGLTAAIALAVGGVETVLVAKRPERPDNRTSALLAGSVAMAAVSP